MIRKLHPQSLFEIRVAHRQDPWLFFMGHGYAQQVVDHGPCVTTGHDLDAKARGHVQGIMGQHHVQKIMDQHVFNKSWLRSLPGDDTWCGEMADLTSKLREEFNMHSGTIIRSFHRFASTPRYQSMK